MNTLRHVLSFDAIGLGGDEEHCDSSSSAGDLGTRDGLWR
jgi:hypothetical protein